LAEDSDGSLLELARQRRICHSANLIEKGSDMRIQRRLVVIAPFSFLASVACCSAGPLDTWHVRRLPQTTNVLNAVTYGGGLFVAVGNSGDKGEILTSPDGMVWTSQASGATTPLADVVWGNGRFVAVGGASSTPVVVTSTDGIVWTPGLVTPSFTRLGTVTFGNGLFVAFGGSTSFTSSDGMNWTRASEFLSRWCPYGIGYGQGAFVSVGWCIGGIYNAIRYSTNGTNWTEAQGSTVGEEQGYFAVTWAAGQFVAVGFRKTATSTNGREWIQRQDSSGSSFTLWDVAYGDEVFVAVGCTSLGGEYCDATAPARIQTSSEGREWRVRDTGWTNALWGVAYGNGRFVAVGTGGAILQSDDTRPRLDAQMGGSSGEVELSVSGGLARGYRLQAAAELPSTNWTDLLTFTNTAPTTNFVDTSATNFSQRFYRVVSP
jgi:hypothetical protein